MAKYDPAMCAKVTKLLATGDSKRVVCAHLGISNTTFERWVKRYPAFRDAAALGFDKSYAFWHDLGKQLALDGNGQVWAMTMGNRFGWRSKHQVGGDAGPLRIEIVDVTGGEASS